MVTIEIGAKLVKSASEVMATQSSLQDVDHIICNIGINNRDDLHVPNMIQHLENIDNGAQHASRNLLGWVSRNTPLFHGKPCTT